MTEENKNWIMRWMIKNQAKFLLLVVEWIALQGRVPVKVSDENGPIRVDDRLTVSKSRPGYAMKMTEPGESIGMALEPFPAVSSTTLTAGGTASLTASGSVSMGTVMTFVNLGFSFGSSSDEPINSTSTAPTGLLSQFTDVVKTALENLGVNIYQGIIRIKEMVADKITAHTLCVDDTCVTRDQLKSLLDRNSVAPASLLLSSTPTSTSTSSSTSPQVATTTAATSTSAISTSATSTSSGWSNSSSSSVSSTTTPQAATSSPR